MRLLSIGTVACSLVTALVVSCVTSRALATPPPAAGLELGARVAAEANDQSLGALAGVQVDWRVVPLLALGAYGDLTPVYLPTRSKCGCYEPRGRPVRVGAFAELHLLPGGLLDPFLRAGIGVLDTHRTSADSELGAGVDVRVGHFAFGPFGAWIATFSGDQPKRWIVLGGRIVLTL